MSGRHLSKSFAELIKAIGESKTKQEEDRIIKKEIVNLKTKFKTKSSKLSKRDKKEFLVRLIYAEMLGHDASFGYIRAVELTADSDVENKRVGYLCSSLCLSPEHEFRFMLVNVMSGDLASPNRLIACTALTAVTKIATKDMIPVLLPKVHELMKHEYPRIRSKAVMAMQRLRQLDPHAVQHLTKSFRSVLCDPDPSVMAASLNIIHDLVRENPSAWKDLTGSFVSILKQVVEHRLPDSFDYHRIPAPWIQMKLLRILAVLGTADPTASEKIYAVLHTCMKRSDTGINVGYAIVYECVRTATSIYPNAKLLESAATAIGRFISSDNQNLKYLGVTSLANIVKEHPSLAAKHQAVVLDCLEDPDETIKRKTLALLARMTNDMNVGVVTQKSIQFLRETTDEFLRKQLVSRITTLAERYAPSTLWYVETIVTVLEIAGDIVQPNIVRSLMRIIAEGADEDAEDEQESDDEEMVSSTDSMRISTVNAFLKLCEKPNIPQVLVQVVAWTLGEYGFMVNDETPLPEIAKKLCELAKTYPKARGHVVTALVKITAQLGSCLPEILTTIKKFGNSKDTDVQQRCLELTALLQEPDLMKEVLPVDASMEDIDIDEDLSFLNGFVKQALDNGAKPYNPPTKTNFASLVAGLGGFGDDDEDGLGLRYEAYDQPTIPDDFEDEDDNNNDDDDDEEDLDEKNDYEEEKKSSPKKRRSNNNTLGGSGVKGPWGADGYQVEIEKKKKKEQEERKRREREEQERLAAENIVEDDFIDETEQVPEEEDDNDNDEGEMEEEEEKPRELTEREKLAASLFGGGGITTTQTWGSRRKGRRSKSPTKPKPDVAAVEKPKQQDDDLLGGLFGDSEMTTNTTKQDNDDLLGDLGGDDGFGGGGDNDNNGDDLLGLGGFGDDDDDDDDDTTQQQDDDGLGLFDTDSSTTTTSSSMPDLRRVQAPAEILRMCAGGNTRIPSSGENALLDSHGTLQFSYFKILRADDIVVVVFVGNAAMKATQLVVSAASNVSCLDVSQVNRLSVPSCGFVTMCTHVKCKSNDIRGLSSAALQLKLQSSSSNIPMSVIIPLDSRDFLRPKRMATKQFGPRWTSSNRRGLGEKRIALHSNCSSLDDLVRQLSEKIALYPIETIHKTSEHIASLNIMGIVDFEALVHVKFTKKTKRTANMTIRAHALLLELVGGLVRTSIK